MSHVMRLQVTFFGGEVREGVDDANVISCAEEMCHDYRLHYLV